MIRIHAFALAAFVALSLSPAPVFAGGADLEAIIGDTEHGAPFFGEATDIKA